MEGQILQSAQKHQPQKWRWLIIALLVVSVTGGIFAWLWQQSKEVSLVNTSGIDSLASKNVVIDADVTALDKTEAFYAYVLNAVQQPKVLTTAVHWLASSSTASHDIYTREITGFDYKTKTYVHASDDVTPTGLVKLVCIGNQEFIMPQNTGVNQWLDRGNKTDSSSSCQAVTAPGRLMDGFLTGGLSADQAKTFVGYLKAKEGLLRVTDLKLTPHNNKQYFHFYVDLKPVAYGNQGNLGLQWLTMAFKRTGLDPKTWPYAYAPAGGPFDGYHMEYWIDAKTKLPVHSEIHKVAGIDEKGNSLPDDTFYQYNTSFDFTKSTFDVQKLKDNVLAVPMPQ